MLASVAETHADFAALSRYLIHGSEAERATADRVACRNRLVGVAPFQWCLRLQAIRSSRRTSSSAIAGSAALISFGRTNLGPNISSQTLPMGAGWFVLHALQLTRRTGGSVAMLLNLASLCHPKRHELWVENPPAAIYALDELVCWPEGYAGHTSFAWLSAKRFRVSVGSS
jgi:hypothetical protein